MHLRRDCSAGPKDRLVICQPIRHRSAVWREAVWGQHQRRKRVALVPSLPRHMAESAGHPDSTLPTLSGRARVPQGGRRGCVAGVYGAAFPTLVLNVAVKWENGNTARACEVVMAALLEGLLPLQGEAAAFSVGLSNVVLDGIEAGRLRADAACASRTESAQRLEFSRLQARSTAVSRRHCFAPAARWRCRCPACRACPRCPGCAWSADRCGRRA